LQDYFKNYERISLPGQKVMRKKTNLVIILLREKKKEIKITRLKQRWMTLKL